MKYFKSSMIVCFVAIISSCATQEKMAKSKPNNESYTRYLSSIINDTTFFEMPELKIIDDAIYPILDSVILWSENCKYVDVRIKNLYSFRFGVKPENGKFLYSVDAHKSPAQAIGLTLLETGVIKKIRNLGIIYYKHYLFVLPMADYGDQKELEYFPFAKKTNNMLKIRAPKFFEEKVYSSYITFSKESNGYKITDIEVCGSQILVQ